MKKIITLCLLFISLISKSQTTAQISETFLNKMLRGQYDSCIVFFDTSVTSQLNPDIMQSMWERIPQFVGEYKSYEDIRTEKIDTLEAVLIRCTFEKTKLDLKLVYNKVKKIVGIFFLPPKSKNTYNPPVYYETSKLYESKLSVKTGTLEMPGMLCVPNNITYPPIVILIAGSGPNDKDETIGPNKPLKDIALGLASNGIASLRYDKRTLTHGSKLDFNKTGINEEVIEDVLSSINILRNHPLTKESKIFIAGHSLGGMCAPLIALKSKDLSGIILLAGPARPLEDLILEQCRYLLSSDSTIKDIEKELEPVKQQVTLVKNKKALKKAEAKDLPLSATSYYWQSLKKEDQLSAAKKVKPPVLVLQGEKDYQVLMTDFNLWKKELESNPKNKFISYPDLNHLFMKSEGKSLPGEYMEQNNVEKKVILDIADFVKGVK